MAGDWTAAAPGTSGGSVAVRRGQRSSAQHGLIEVQQDTQNYFHGDRSSRHGRLGAVKALKVIRHITHIGGRDRAEQTP